MALDFGLFLAAMLMIMTGIVRSDGAKIAVVLILTVLGAATYVYFLQNIYLPNVQLEKLMRTYLGNGDVELDGAEMSEEDLLEKIGAIMSSLDTIAVRQKNAEILLKNAEINTLQNQINPHVLYNTLEVIRGESLLNGDRKTADMTASLANYFRYNISRKESFVFLQDELKNSRNYFNIQKNRYRDKISCEILYHDTDEHTVGRAYIPKLILQPIIENAIYHGLELKMGKGRIRIHITATEKNLKIMVEDDGLGMPQEKLDALNSDIVEGKTEGNQKHNGVAIENIKKRLKLYWGDRAYLLAASEPGVGTQIHLSMPLLYEKEEYMN